MGIVSDLVRDVKIPKMIKVAQRFAAEAIDDVPARVLQELSHQRFKGRIKPGMRIAICAGSRGIHNYAPVIRHTVDFLKAQGVQPFIIPAMGSHGGANAAGQLEILEGYGITEAQMGCPIHSSMETLQIGTTLDGRFPVFIDKHAAQADGIILVNRIKPHTAFRGPYESGLMKMLAIGLSKQKGAEFCHSLGFKHMAEMIPLFGKAIIHHANIVLGIAIVENAYDQTSHLVALTDQEIIDKEPALLDLAKSSMPRILIDQADLLIVDEIGKNISGDGMDPNISGTFAEPYASGGIQVQRVAVLDITQQSHGNTIGWGMADCSTKRAFDKFDPEMTYPNSLTCRVTQVSKMPMIFRNDRECIQGAIKTMSDVDYDNIRVIRIKNTLSLAEIEVSANLKEIVEGHEQMEILSEPFAMPFDAAGNLL